MEPDVMILVFWMLSFKPTFSLSSFTFIKRFFSSSPLSAIRVVTSAYLSLLLFLPTILIPACASSSLAFHMMHSAYKLNKQGDNIQPWCTPFPNWNQSFVLKCWRRCEKKELLYMVGGDVNCCSHYGGSSKDSKSNYYVFQQFHFWVYIWREHKCYSKAVSVPPHSMQHYLRHSIYEKNLVSVNRCMH